MIGWRARLGFLLPPGNPTVEPEMIALAPEGVSVHFHRMTARGATGSLEGQDERNRMILELLEQDLGKPVLSSASAMVWHALRLAGVREPISGYGRLLTLS